MEDNIQPIRWSELRNKSARKENYLNVLKKEKPTGWGRY